MKSYEDVNPSPEDLALQESPDFQLLLKQWAELATVQRAELTFKVANEGHRELVIARNLGKDESTIRRDLNIARLPESHKTLIRGGANATTVLLDFRRS